MRLRTRDRRRLMLLAAMACAIVIGAFLLVFVRNWQGKRMAERYRVQSVAAYERHDYLEALGKSGSYLKKRSSDADQLLIYARSREQVQEPDRFSNLREAVGFYQRYLVQRPDDAKVRMDLLKLYNRAGFFAECVEAAQKLRPARLEEATAKDLPVLQQEVLALINQRQFTDPRVPALLDRIAALDPLDLTGNFLRLRVIMETHPERARSADARAFAKTVLDAHPDDPRALLLAAGADATTMDQESIDAAVGHLRQAAGIDASGKRASAPRYSDAETASRIVDMGDALRDFDLSFEVLKDAQRFNDPDLTRTLVRRTWQEGGWAEVERLTAQVDPTRPDSDPELAGFRALALNNLGREEEARAIAAALKARKGDYRVTAWTKALPIRFDTKKPALDQVRDLRDLVKGDSNEPVFMVWLGDALATLGRNDEARDFWKSAADIEKVPEGRSWPLPHVRTAESLLLDGRVDEAVAAASRAAAIASNRALVAVVFFEAHAARIQKGTPGRPTSAELLAGVRRIKERLAALDGESIRTFSERLIVPEVVFLAREDRDAAIKLIKDTLGSGRPLKPQTLQRLASVSTLERLGLEADILATVKADESSANVRFQQAIDKAMQGNPEEGRKLLADALAAGPDDVGNWIALGRFLDRLGQDRQPEAVKVWKDLAAKFPDDLNAQRACLGSPSLAKERELVEQVIARYQAKTGAEPGAEDVLTRVARARTMLVGDGISSRDRDRAIALLGSVVGSQPSLVEPKVLLARALMMDDPARGIAADLPRAITHLNDALTLEPRSVDIALDLGRLLAIQGQYAKAKEKLDPIAREKTLAPEVRFAAVRMLMAQGDNTSVPLEALIDIAANAGDNASSAVLVALAEAYQARGLAGESQTLYTRLADGKADDPESLYKTSKYFASKGDQARAEALRQKLQSVKAEPGQRELILARLALERNDRQAADAAYEEAVRATPKEPQVWIQYAGSYLLQGKPEGYAKAVEIAKRGLEAIPNQLDLVAFQTSAEALQNGKEAELFPLVQMLGFGNPDSKRILTLSREALARGELNSVDGIRKLAGRAPTSVALQMFAAQRMAALDPVAATELVNRSLAASPSDPAPARMACTIFFALERWPDLLQAARAWRQRDGTQSAEPDLAIARAQIGLQQFPAALATLEPRLAAAIASPEDAVSLDVLNLYCKTLVQSGRDDRALRVIEPLFKTSQQARILIGMGIAGRDVKTLDRARVWIDAIRAATPPASPNDQLALAMTYALLATKYPGDNTPLLSQAEDILKALSQSEGATAQIWECLGIVRSRRTDIPGAEEAYRKAIAIDPNSVNALNNLANIEAETNGRLEPALAFAQRAVAAQPGNPDAIDTLASIQYQLGRQARSDGNAKDAEARFRESLANYRRLAAIYSNRGNSAVTAINKAAIAALDAGDSIQAAELFESLLLIPGLGRQDTAAVQNNLASLLIEINRGRADLDRAQTLMDAAMRAQPDVPEFYDTLGWLSSARGRFGDAETAFRKSIALSAAANKPTPPSSRIGLATLLAASPEPTKVQEARSLLDPIDEKALDPTLKPKLEHARQLLKQPKP